MPTIGSLNSIRTGNKMPCWIDRNSFDLRLHFAGEWIESADAVNRVPTSQRDAINFVRRGKFDRITAHAEMPREKSISLRVY